MPFFSLSLFNLIISLFSLFFAEDMLRVLSSVRRADKLIGTRSFPSGSRLFSRSIPATAGAAPPKKPAAASPTKAAAAPAPVVNQKWREKVQKSLKVDPQTALIWHTNDVHSAVHFVIY